MRSKGLDTKSSEASLAMLLERAEALSQTLSDLRRAKWPTYAERQQASEASVRALIQEYQREQTNQTAQLRAARLERDASFGDSSRPVSVRRER
jgi:hypothetical protein